MKNKVLLLLTIFTFCYVNNGISQEVKINHDGTNGFAIEVDGTYRADGTATTWRDELHPLIGETLDARQANITTNYEEFTVDFQDDADYQDAVVMNIQLNHDWDGSTPVEPHIHWFQNHDTLPNWLIGYRWHQNGQSKVETWTYLEIDHTVFTYDSGTLLQISSFPSINPPATPTGVSSILQLKLMRDNGNTRQSYATKDNYIGVAQALSLDIHIRIDTQGSRTEFSK